MPTADTHHVQTGVNLHQNRLDDVGFWDKPRL